jgi:hypothetical protein
MKYFPAGQHSILMPERPLSLEHASRVLAWVRMLQFTNLWRLIFEKPRGSVHFIAINSSQFGTSLQKRDAEYSHSRNVNRYDYRYHMTCSKPDKCRLFNRQFGSGIGRNSRYVPSIWAADAVPEQQLGWFIFLLTGRSIVYCAWRFYLNEQRAPQSLADKAPRIFWLNPCRQQF